MKNKEFILCAAIWINDDQTHDQQPINIDVGYVVCGRRHNNCYQTIISLKGDLNTYIKSLNLTKEDYKLQNGFITSLDRYVSRKEGWEIAMKNNQIQFGKDYSDEKERILASENLY